MGAAKCACGPGHQVAEQLLPPRLTAQAASVSRRTSEIGPSPVTHNHPFDALRPVTPSILNVSAKFKDSGRDRPPALKNEDIIVLLPELVPEVGSLRRLQNASRDDCNFYERRSNCDCRRREVRGEFLSYTMATKNVGAGPLIVKYDLVRDKRCSSDPRAVLYRIENARQVVWRLNRVTGNRLQDLEIPLPADRVNLACRGNPLTMNFVKSSLLIEIWNGEVAIEGNVVRRRTRLVPVSSTYKEYWCFRDSAPIDAGARNPRSLFPLRGGLAGGPTCFPELGIHEDRKTYEQGITHGYKDDYPQEVCDQFIDIGGVPNGEYVFVLDMNYGVEPLFLEQRPSGHSLSVRIVLDRSSPTPVVVIPV